MSAIYRLGEIARVVGGGTPDRSNSEYWNGEIPWVTVKDVQSDRISGSLERITKRGLEKSATNLIPTGSIVVPTRMALGRVAINDLPIAINQDLKALIIDTSKIDRDFLHQFLLSKAAYFESRGKGATVKGITLDVLTELEVPKLPLLEQRRIAAILREANAICKKRGEVLGLADQFLRSVFLDMFGGLLSGPTDQWQALSTCTDFIDYRGKTPEKSDAGVRLITAKNVRDGVINVERAEFISEETYSWWMSRGYPQSGDVLFTTEAPLGNIAVLRTDEPVAIGQRLIAIRPREMLRSDFLSWALRQDIIQRDIFSRATGSTVKGIRSAELVQVRIPIPTEAEQLKFERIVASVHHQKVVMQASAVQGEQLFQALQEQAFQGRL